MKRVLIILAMLAGVAQAETNLLFVSRVVDTNRYFVPVHGKTTPEEFGSNCVFYLNANSPVIDEGTTSATWLDFSGEENDATQTGTGYQPERVFTNGAWVWNFDGVDDYVALGQSIENTALLTVTALVRLRSSDFSFTLVGGGVIKTGIALGCYKSGTSVRFISRAGNPTHSSYVQAIPTIASANSFFDDELHLVEMVVDAVAETLNVRIDGDQIVNSAYSGSLATNNIVQWIGKHNSGSLGQSYNRADIAWIRIQTQ